MEKLPVTHDVHNSFDVIQLPNKVRVKSHDFPAIQAEGKDVNAAVNELNEKIMKWAESDIEGFVDNINKRIERGVACGCGYVTAETPIGVFIPRETIPKLRDRLKEVKGKK